MHFPPSTNHTDQKRGLECPPPTTQTRREGWSALHQPRRPEERAGVEASNAAMKGQRPMANKQSCKGQHRDSWTSRGWPCRVNKQGARGSTATAGPAVDGHAGSANKAEGAAHGQLDQPWMAMQDPQTRRKGQYRDSWISRGWPCRVWRAYDNGVNYGINDSVRQYHGPTADTSTSKHHTIPHMYAPKPSVHPNAKSDPAGDAAKARAISILGQRRRNTKRPMTTDKQAGQQRQARERGPRKDIKARKPNNTTAKTSHHKPRVQPQPNGRGASTSSRNWRRAFKGRGVAGHRKPLDHVEGRRWSTARTAYESGETPKRLKKE